MPAPVLEPLTASIAGNRTDNTGWKLNQQLLATVVNGDNGRKNLRINGNIYAPLQYLHVETGKTLTLVVKSLSPYIELGLRNRSLMPQRSEGQSGIILSQNIQQWPGQNLQASASSLARFMSFLNAPSVQPLPATTAALVTALIDRIAVPEMLTNPATLKPALLHAGLLLGEGSTTAGMSVPGNDLRSLLIQLVRSLAGTSTSDPGRLLENSGLTLYQQVSRAGTGFPLLMARELGEELLQMSKTQKQEQETIELYERRWVFELPVNFQDRLSSVYVRLFEEKSRKKQHRAMPGWAAVFEFELPGFGDLKVELKIEDLAVSVVIICTNNKAASRLEENQHSLREKLESLGLLLSSLQCCPTAKPGSKVKIPVVSKPSTNRENIPLRNFHMQENARELNPADGIPEFLYCGMAALFGYLFDIEESIR